MFQQIVFATKAPVVFAIGTGAPTGAHVTQHLPVEANLAISGSTAEAIDRSTGGVPFTAAGRVAVGLGAVTRIGPGPYAYDAAGRLAVGGATARVVNGVPRTAAGGIAST